MPPKVKDETPDFFPAETPDFIPAEAAPAAGPPAGNLSTIPEEKPVPSLFSGEYRAPLTVGSEHIMSTVAPGETLPHAVSRQVLGGIGRAGKTLYHAIPNLVEPHDTAGATKEQEKSFGPLGRILYNIPADTTNFIENSPQVVEQAKQGTVGPAAEVGTMALAPPAGRTLLNGAFAHMPRMSEPAIIKMIKEGLQGGSDVEKNIERATPYIRDVGKWAKDESDIHTGLDTHRSTIGQKIQDQVARRPNIVISGNDIAHDVGVTVTPETRKFFPEAAQQIIDEAGRYVGKDISGPEALNLAATLRAMKQRYFDAPAADKAAAERASGSIRAIDAAHDALVDKLAERLEALGEVGVKEMRADYGALRKMTDAAYNAKVKAGESIPPTFSRSLGQEGGRLGASLLGAGSIATLAAGHPMAAVAEAGMIPATAGIRYLYQRSQYPTYRLVKGVRALGKMPGDVPDYTPRPNAPAGLLGTGTIALPPVPPIPGPMAPVPTGLTNRANVPGRLLGAGEPGQARMTSDLTRVGMDEMARKGAAAPAPINMPSDVSSTRWMSQPGVELPFREPGLTPEIPTVTPQSWVLGPVKRALSMLGVIKDEAPATIDMKRNESGLYVPESYDKGPLERRGSGRTSESAGAFEQYLRDNGITREIFSKLSKESQDAIINRMGSASEVSAPEGGVKPLKLAGRGDMPLTDAELSSAEEIRKKGIQGGRPLRKNRPIDNF